MIRWDGKPCGRAPPIIPAPIVALFLTPSRLFKLPGSRVERRELFKQKEKEKVYFKYEEYVTYRFLRSSLETAATTPTLTIILYYSLLLVLL